MIQIYNKNYLESENILFDLIFTDIPYNIGADAYASSPSWWIGRDFRNGQSTKAESNFFEKDEDFNVDEWLRWCYEHLKENGRLISFVSIEQLSYIILNYKKYNFKNYTPLIFIKNSSGEVLKANMRICGACEYGIILYKNKLGYYNNNKKMIKNWFNFERQYKPFHPSQKPLELCKQIINLYVKSGDLVCDTCMGAGNIIIACKELGIDCVGFEIDKKYYDIAHDRIVGGDV